MNRKKPVWILLSVCVVASFTLGYVFAATSNGTNWVGFLTYGVEVEVDPMVRPRPSGFTSEVSGEIRIGLREDGVVVWEKIAQDTD
jgi:hypothetical protein